MKHGIALIVIVAMIVSGCVAARGAVTTRPLAAAHADPAIAAFVRSLPPGSRVRVETSTGRSIRGTLLQATDDVVAIERHTRIPEPPVRVGMNEVTRRRAAARVHGDRRRHRRGRRGWSVVVDRDLRDQRLSNVVTRTAV